MAELAIIGGGLQAMGSMQQGRAAQQEASSMRAMAEYNAAVQRRQAEAERQKARFEQKRQAQAGKRTMAALEARIAKAGGTGSPVAADLAAEQAAELELENLLIGYEGETRAQRSESQAAIDTMQAGIYKKRGKNYRRAGMIGAGTSLLTGFGQYYG